MEKLMNNTNCIIATMTTVNLTSITTYADFVRELMELRGKYNPLTNFNKVQFMTNFLRYPEFLALPILDDQSKIEFTKSIETLIDEYGSGKAGAGSLSIFEVDQLRRMVDHMNQNTPANVQTCRQDFAKFITEYDSRRGTNFHDVFPSLSNFYKICQEA